MKLKNKLIKKLDDKLTKKYVSQTFYKRIDSYDKVEKIDIEV